MSALWYKASQLVGVVGLPSHRTSIVRKAKREGWRSRPFSGRGGGDEYFLDSLPAETQAALLKQQAAESIEFSLESGTKISAIAETQPQELRGRGGPTYIDADMGAVDAPTADATTAADSTPAGSVNAAPTQDLTDFGSGSPKAGTGNERANVPVSSCGEISAIAETQPASLGHPSQENPPPTPSKRGDGAGALAVIEHVEMPLTKPEKKAEQKIHARLEILRAHQAYCGCSELGVVDCEYEFCDKYKTGEIEVTPWVRKLIPKFSRNTLRRWGDMVKAGDLLGLAPKYQGRPGLMIDEQPLIKQFILVLIAKSPTQLNSCRILEALETRFKGVKLPSEPTIRRYVERWCAENQQVFARLKSPDDWKNKFMPAFGSYSEGVDRVNQLWELDSTPADIALAEGIDSDGAPVMRRYHIIGCIDVFSRRGMLLVTKVSKAAAIAQLFRACLIAWGVPERIKTDNGSDYKSVYFQQVVASLGIEQHFCAPYKPEQKGHIESFLGTYSHDLMEMLPGYLGHSVAERKALEGQRSFAERLGQGGKLLDVPMTVELFSAFTQEWCEARYNNREHGAIGMSPNMRAASCTAPVRRIQDDRVLDLLLTEGKEATVNKKGIRIGKNPDGTVRWYVAPELGGLVKERLHYRFTDDAGRVLVFKDAYCREFVCVAECPDLTGIDRRALALQAKRVANAQKAAVRELKQAGKTLGIDELPFEILAAAKDAATHPALQAPLPGGGLEAAVPDGAMEAISYLAGMDVPVKAEPLTEENLALRAELEAVEVEAASRTLAPVEDPDDWYYQIWKYKTHGVGAVPSEEDEKRWGRVQQTSERRRLERLAEGWWDLQFGEDCEAM
ncbi:MAG: DDE-type integrase/transposase/recombinase [Leptolyngbyaceae cyanobacterium]